MCKLVKDKIAKVPIIAFIAKNDAQVLEALTTAARATPDVNSCYFTDPLDAMGAKTDASMVKNGLYILQEKFARGFDLKFAMNAYVLVFSNNSYYFASTIRQMVGRANRAQGVAHGRVFILSQNFMIAETDINYIEQKDKLRNSDVGAAVSMFLVKEYLERNLKDRTTLFQLFVGQKWRLQLQTYHTFHKSVKDVLSVYLD